MDDNQPETPTSGTGTRRRGSARSLLLPRVDMPARVEPQLCQLVKAAPDGTDWLHEIKFDGYRMHARLDAGEVRLLTRTGLDWTDKYPRVAEALKSLPVS